MFHLDRDPKSRATVLRLDFALIPSDGWKNFALILGVAITADIACHSDRCSATARVFLYLIRVFEPMAT